MNLHEMKILCPVKIGQMYRGGRVTFILGDSQGWGVWVKKECDMGYETEHYYRISLKRGKVVLECSQSI